jgi:hypothetical protein
MFILKILNIEAKRSKLILKCESSEAKQSKANWFISNLHNIKAKQTGSLVILYLKSRKKANFRFFFKRKATNESVR